jgi:hypothetical protein
LPRKAGVVTVDINAGTASWVVDIDKAKSKLREEQPAFPLIVA